MRVVFFLQGQLVPASRARGFAIARALEQAGVECELRVPYPSVYGDVRWPAPWGRLRPLWAPASLVARIGQLGDLLPTDVVFFQRPMTEYPTLALERFAARGRQSIFDFDDAIYERRFGRAKLRGMTAIVDHVIAGNRTLADVVAAPAKTTVIPTAVDTDRFAQQPSRDVRGRDVVVGWTGLAVSYVQLVSARKGIGRALERTGARLLLISDRPPPRELQALRPEFVRWRPETEIEDLARIDVGIMPLRDDPIARGKCAYKLIQYMALGLSGVASPVGANREVVTEGVDGFLPVTDGDWEEALVRLIEDPGLRRSMGERARHRAESGYSIRSVVPAYLDVIRRLASG